MSAPRVVAEPFSASSLSRAALEETAPHGWYVPRPRGREAWRQHAEQVRRPFSRTRWLDAIRPAISPSGVAARRLERVAADNGVIVTTGQQPGLFGGPGYTWLKALSALALADRLERELGLPVAPVFWAATDDADFEEASFTTISVGNECRHLSIERQRPESVVMSEMPLGDVDAQMASFIEAAGSAPHHAILDALRASYKSGATVGSAYVQFLRAVLEPLGISVLDAWHPSVRKAARPVLVEALQRAAAVEESVALRIVAIERAGYRAQVARVPRLSLVFRSEEGVKERVPIAQAADEAERHDGVLSPNVLLRPVVEQRLMPTLAYMGGPGEIAYFAQVGAVAEALGSNAPLVLPRWSATIVEPAVDRMLGRLGMVLDDVLAPHAAERRIGERAMPAAVRDALVALQTAVGERIDALAAAQQPAALVSDEVIAGARAQMKHRVERLERRLRAAAARGEQEAMDDLTGVRAAILPQGVRQERRLNFVPLLARHGDGLLAQLMTGAAVHAGTLIGTA